MTDTYPEDRAASQEIAELREMDGVFAVVPAGSQRMSMYSDTGAGTSTWHEIIEGNGSPEPTSMLDDYDGNRGIAGFVRRLRCRS